jgi:hypothetical protein
MPQIVANEREDMIGGGHPTGVAAVLPHTLVRSSNSHKVCMQMEIQLTLTMVSLVSICLEKEAN